MTSKVTVSAHCAPDKEVVFAVGEDISILQDGQTAEKQIYDQCYAFAFERNKTADEHLAERLSVWASTQAAAIW